MVFALTNTAVVSPGVSAVGLGFTLDAYNAGGQPLTQFSAPFTITVGYSDSQVQGVDPLSLKLYYQDPQSGYWIAIPTEVDINRRTLTAVLNHMTRFAVLGSARYSLYMPLVRR